MLNFVFREINEIMEVEDECIFVQLHKKVNEWLTLSNNESNSNDYHFGDNSNYNHYPEVTQKDYFLPYRVNAS